MTIVSTNPVYNYNAEENFEPYTHQVGGHCCILKFASKICKPLIQREYEFYCTIHQDFPLLCSITPEFYGYLAVPKTLLNHEPKSASDKKKPSYSTTDSQSAVNLGLDKDRMDPHQYYIVLHDLTAGMFKPCVMDMKMGTYRQRFDTSVLLGYRLCGMRAWRGDELHSVDRLFGRGLTTDTVEDAVSAFLFDGQVMRTPLIPPLLKKLRNILSVLDKCPFRFYTSSLLFIYDGAAYDPRIDVRIVDFAHAIYKNTKEGEPEDGVLFGLRNLITLFEHILERYGLSDAHSESDSEEDSLDVHSDQDTEEDEESSIDDSNAASSISNRCAPFQLSAPPSLQAATCRPLDV